MAATRSHIIQDTVPPVSTADAMAQVPKAVLPDDEIAAVKV
ncbi:MAG: hypothetical protein U9R10_04830 [Euryarchaeota archaeon]|nr:hypothetical protein [Euryarchaeota archaeon]